MTGIELLYGDNGHDHFKVTATLKKESVSSKIFGLRPPNVVGTRIEACKEGY